LNGRPAAVAIQDGRMQTMPELINTIILTGRINKLEISQTQNMKLCRIYLAVEGETGDDVQELKVVLFAEKTPQCEGLKEGDRIVVLGSLNIRTWGKEGKEIEVHAKRVIPLAEKEKKAA